jgi:hypothetical protein
MENGDVDRTDLDYWQLGQMADFPPLLTSCGFLRTTQAVKIKFVKLDFAH